MFSHFADAFIQSDLQLGNTWSDSSWRGKHTEEVLVMPSLRHCSNKYKIAREGEKETNSYLIFLYSFFSLWWSQAVSKEMSFQLLLEDWQWSSIPDRGGKIIQKMFHFSVFSNFPLEGTIVPKSSQCPCYGGSSKISVWLSMLSSVSMMDSSCTSRRRRRRTLRGKYV